MAITATRKTALILVDVQPTFCEGGELGVPGGNATAKAIADYLRRRGAEYDILVTTQDWHIDPGNHWSESPDFVDTWPPHGIADTPNAQLHPQIAGFTPNISVKKGQYEAAYSGFEGVDEDGHSLLELLVQEQITHLDIAGIAESHCVKDTAVDAIRYGFNVRVLSDLTVPVSPELGSAARKIMRRAGVELVFSRSQ